MKYVKLFEDFSKIKNSINNSFKKLLGDDFKFREINGVKLPLEDLPKNKEDLDTLDSSVGITVDYALQIIEEYGEKRNPKEETVNMPEKGLSDDKLIFDKNKSYFLRWTDDPNDDVERNFSGHLQTWVSTEEEAWKSRNEEEKDGREFLHKPKQDPVTTEWNYDPEWGISGYYFNNKESFEKAMSEIREISYFHKEGRGQDLYLFSANEIGNESGYDGEDLFRDIKPIMSLDMNDKFEEIFKL